MKGTLSKLITLVLLTICISWVSCSDDDNPLVGNTDSSGQRQRIARIFGCDPEEIAITRNASESMEIALYGLDLKRGDSMSQIDEP